MSLIRYLLIKIIIKWPLLFMWWFWLIMNHGYKFEEIYFMQLYSSQKDTLFRLIQLLHMINSLDTISWLRSRVMITDLWKGLYSLVTNFCIRRAVLSFLCVCLVLGTAADILMGFETINKRLGSRETVKVLKCFSIYTNGRKVLNTNSGGEGHLNCLNGIRWVMTHVCRKWPIMTLRFFV